MPAMQCLLASRGEASAPRARSRQHVLEGVNVKTGKMSRAEGGFPKHLVWLIQVHGIVQGVGFRPFTLCTARELELGGCDGGT